MYEFVAHLIEIILVFFEIEKYEERDIIDLFWVDFKILFEIRIETA